MYDKRKYWNGGWLLVLPAGAIFLAVGLAPLMTTFNYSLQDTFSGDQYFWAGAHWYETTLHSSAFWASLGRTLLFAAITLTLQFALGIFIARKLYHTQKHPEIFIALFSLPLLAPWIVVGFLWRQMMGAETGLIGVVLSAFALPPDFNAISWSWTTIILMDLWHWTSLVVILCYAGYLAIPPAYFQAASIDGANGWAVFRHVELPKLRNVLIIAALLRFADSLMIYIEPFMITRGGPDTATTFISQDLIQTATQEFNLGEAGATSVIYLLLVVPVSWLLFKAMRVRHA